MDNKEKLLKRLVALGVLLFVGIAVVCAALIKIQLIDGEEYSRQADKKLTGSTIEYASRGEILDRYGRPLVTNKTVYSLCLNYNGFDFENQNEMLRNLADLVDSDGAEVIGTLPISKTAPFVYTEEEDSSARKYLKTYLSDRKAPDDLTAEEALNTLREAYEIPEDYSANDARKVIEVRYEMEHVGFSRFNSYTMAEDISIELVSVIKEQHQKFPGADIALKSVREYETTYAAHLLGRVGPIFKEEWEEYKEKGYNLNATVGKDGMEKVLEEYLKSTDGKKMYEIAVDGSVVSSEDKSGAVPGKNCMLTIDLALQKTAEDSLKEHLTELPYAEGGAAVVLEANSGEVLAMASYPTYDLETYSENYHALEEDALTPMLNRAINGLYAPGSTYKVLTAIAGLEEGVIDANTSVRCTGVYSYFGYHPKCHKRSGHGTETVTTAIRDSCNIFFYETGKLLGAEKLEEWAARFGLGEKTGIELSDSRGMVAGPGNTERLREAGVEVYDWTGGNTLQAAIGQSDNQFSPLQLANYIATVVNGGTRYAPHLLKSVKAYDYSETVYEQEPEVLGQAGFSEKTYELVMTGMNEVVNEGGTAAKIFRDYPIEIGGKSGTAQRAGQEHDNGIFVAFAPYDDPEIVVCVVGEKAESGSNVAPVVRDIFDAYFGSRDESDHISTEYTMGR